MREQLSKTEERLMAELVARQLAMNELARNDYYASFRLPTCAAAVPFIWPHGKRETDAARQLVKRGRIARISSTSYTLAYPDED